MILPEVIILKRSAFFTFLKEKSFIIVLALLVISAGTMVALFQAGGKAYREQNQVAEKRSAEEQKPIKASTEKKKENPPEAVKKTVVRKKTETKKEKQAETAKVPAEEQMNMEAELEDQYLEAEQLAEVSAGDVVAEEFTRADALTLQWPVEGKVLLGFSMDHSIYFPTLAQYQYNPALIIGAEEGTPVLCAAAGTVLEVGKSNEFGHYVTMDLGDGFEITYGQLFDITAEVGEEIEAGEQIALVAYATRSYVEEGDNLYLKLTKEGTPVDPEQYLD